MGCHHYTEGVVSWVRYFIRVPLHRRWVVERSIAWMGRYRRLSKDYEYDTASSEAQVKLSSIHMLLRRLKPNNKTQQPSFKYPKKIVKAA
jgi:transposase